jgi:MFS family permease
MTGFALGVSVYAQTGSTTDFALIFLAGMLPRALLAPLAGVLADHWDRRRVMILSDLGAALSTLVALALALSGELQLWQIYLVTATNGAFGALRVPAYIASASTLVPKNQYGRIGGMLQLSDALGQVVAPVVAGALMATFRLPSVLLIDLASFGVALLTLAITRFPDLEAPGQARRGSLVREALGGWDFVAARPELLALLLVFAIGNFFVGNAQALLTPMILSFSSPATLGIVLSVGGAGMVVGGVTLSVWGGGKRRIRTVLAAYALLGLSILATGLVPSPLVVGAALFFAYLSLPFVIGASQAVMSSKVTHAVQGRVFALRVLLITTSFTIAYLTAGPLADSVFEPLLAVGGPLAGSIGSLIGVGPGRGIGLMFIVLGLLATLTALVGYAYPRLRRVEVELPDVAAPAT